MKNIYKLFGILVIFATTGSAIKAWIHDIYNHTGDPVTVKANVVASYDNPEITVPGDKQKHELNTGIFLTRSLQITGHAGLEGINLNIDNPSNQQAGSTINLYKEELPVSATVTSYRIKAVVHRTFGNEETYYSRARRRGL